MARAETERELLRAIAISFPQSADRLREQLEALTSSTGLQNERLRENTDAIVQNTVSRNSSSSAAASAGRSMLQAIGGGLLLSPLIRGLTSLFRRPSQETAEPLVAALRPRPLAVEAVWSPESGPAVIDFDQFGRPRPGASQGYGPTSQAEMRQGPSAMSSESERPTPQTHVTIQIQALDSRSILDRSDEIARAVREAMLHSHSVNDVIHEA